MHQPRPSRSAVVYLCTTVHADARSLLDACHTYASNRGWHVVETLHDDTGLSDPTRPAERPALARAIEALDSTDASVLLTVSAGMISSLPAEYDQVTRRVTDAGGFIHTMGWVRTRPADRRSA
ncbi:hypothetical protein IAG44_23605 [Streptomyces roseirectus]|uniref:Resolvase/invertase-type recombinase catalytic domain-containing protein n=1 Tax=Streptomyces roseirectus TaxID=2768066 RepID=A0A7H0IH40_9ACTN|nr:hypothetical protein [Streptomyces roseirectus]QNP72106.1 hypothetical protein IAG44_23605 [Streptomyces roseirectus]